MTLTPFTKIIADCEKNQITLAMPIKDLAQKREYFKKYMAAKRAKKKGLTNSPATGLTGEKATMGLTSELGFPKVPSVKP